MATQGEQSMKNAFPLGEDWLEYHEYGCNWPWRQAAETLHDLLARARGLLQWIGFFVPSMQMAAPL